ncbi:DNRLRE domain-containing protein [Flaviaesturariibacter terrae]
MKPLQFFVISVLTVAASGCHPDAQDVNQAPTAEAGISQTITLPANQLTLQGSGYDSDGSITAYGWSQVSGPNNASFADVNNPATAVTGLVQGNYTFRLTVTDDEGATGSDTVSIHVLPAAAHSVTLQPANNPAERTIGINAGSEVSYSNSIELILAAWTINSDPYLSRSALKFDLSSIPSTATVLSATLYLYSDPQPNNGNLVDANFGADNSFSIRRITSAWTPASTGWANQPPTTTVNEVIVPHTPQSQLDVTADVTAQVNDMLHNGNNGFLLKLQNETIYTSRLFVSSNHSNTAKRPKLVVQYQ